MFGAYQTIKGITSLIITIPNNGVFSVGLFQNLRAFIIVSVILYALVTIGAAFGLIVVSCAVRNNDINYSNVILFKKLTVKLIF